MKIRLITFRSRWRTVLRICINEVQHIVLAKNGFLRIRKDQRKVLYTPNE